MSVKATATAFEGKAVPMFKKVKLKEIVADNCLGGNYQCVEDVTPLPVMKMGNLGRGTITLVKIEYVSDGKVLSDRDVLKKGDILFNTRNTLDLVGKVAMWRGELEQAVFNSNIMRITFSENVLNEYMNYYFNSYGALKQLRARATGTTSVAAIYWRDCQNIKIQLPPLPEQKAIADLLSTWDEAIEKTERLIEAKEKRFKWLLRELISDPQNTQVNTEWKKIKLGDLFGKEIMIEKGKALTQESNLEGDIPVVAGGQTYAYFTNSPTHDIPTVTISASGAYAGYVWYHDYPIWASDCNVLYTTKGITKYLYFTLKGIQHLVYALQSGGAQPHVYSKDMKNLYINWPSMEEQQKIVERLSIAQHEIDLLKQLAEKYKTQKRGLMQKMLTGEWRIKPEIVNQYMEV